MTRPKHACVEKLTIDDTDSIRRDPDIAAFVETASDTLGEDGRFVIRLSGIPQENCVLAEGKSQNACEQCIADFKRLLAEKGFMV